MWWLDTLAQKSGRRFGSAIGWSGRSPDDGSIQNADYTKLIKRECGLIAPENEMKWQRTRAGPEDFDFSRFDDMVDWAGKNDLGIRGHTLLWHRPKAGRLSPANKMESQCQA